MADRVKKFVTGLLAAVLFLFGPGNAAAQEDLGLYARSAVLMDGGSGRVLYEKEAQTELPMASTTKIMTCIVALEDAAPDTVCMVSKHAASQPKVKLGMVQGDTFYLRDLFYSLMLESHNDTAVCIAETIGGSVEGFAERMNAKARELGCTQTHYITPNGLDAEDEGGGHRTTARELALVMRYCLTQSPKAEEFLEITRTPSCTFTNIAGNRSYGCVNHNAFLQIMDGALSGKTGFTAKAGYCYVGALKRDGKLLIVALLACGWPSHKGYKWVDTKKLMNYGLENYELREIAAPTLDAARLSVLDGQQETVRIAIEAGEKLQILMRPEEQIETRVNMTGSLTAPVTAGQRVGEAQCLLDGEAYASYPIVTSESVPKQDFLYCLRFLWETTMF